MSKLTLSKSLLALVAAGIVTTSPVNAQEQKNTHEKPTPEAAEAAPLKFDGMGFQEALRLFQDNGDRWVEEPCEFGVPASGVMLSHRPGDVPIRRVALLSQALCADEEERYEDGAAVVRQLNGLVEGEVNLWLTLYFARRLEDGQWALDTLRSLRPEQLGELERDSFWLTTQTIRESGLEDEGADLALQWFEDSRIGFIDGDLHAGLARSALAAAVRQERVDMAPQLLGYITNPSTYVDMLTSRELEPLWPAIEERAGPNLTSIGAENVEIARRRLTNAPSDRDRFSDAAHALHFNGDFDAAIELAQSWRTREERGLELEEGDAWALNIQAYAYDSLGQPERADAIFEELAAVDPEANFWAVNFVINRASRLVEHGRWEEGLAASEYARTVPGSTYAELIVAKNHACALNRLGRTEEALAELDFVRENKSSSVHLAAVGLLCNGLRDEAAEVLLEGLRDQTTRASAIAALLGAETDLFYTQSMLPEPRALMVEYPELAAEFALHARDLPEAMAPRAALLRTRLDLPEWED